MSEHAHSKALMQIVRLHEARCPELAMLFAVPNGGDRHKATAGKMRAEGVKPGVPDYLLPVARHGFHGLAIELKTETGRTSGEQDQWIRNLKAQGWEAVVCRGWTSAWSVLAQYLGVAVDVDELKRLSATFSSHAKPRGRQSSPPMRVARRGCDTASLKRATRALRW